MPSTLSEAFELLEGADQLAPRLEAAAAALTQLPELASERGWLAAARERLGAVVVRSHRELLDRALRLPELESFRAERGKQLQAEIADEYERLHGGITFAGGARGPLLDVIFHNLKVPALRKCGRTELERFCTEIERRLATSYSVRILATERYLAIAPTLQALRGAFAVWRSMFVDPSIDEAAAAVVRDELANAARAVELPLRQARLLAQAALLPAAELLDAAGVLTQKAKRRGKADDESHPMLEHDPPDPLLPSADEQAEISAVHRAS